MAKRKPAVGGSPGIECKRGDRIRFTTPAQDGEATVISSAEGGCWPILINEITYTKDKRGKRFALIQPSADTHGLLCRDEVLEILKG